MNSIGKSVRPSGCVNLSYKELAKREMVWADRPVNNSALYAERYAKGLDIWTGEPRSTTMSTSDFQEHDFEVERAELLSEMRRDEQPETDGDIDDAAALAELMAEQDADRREMEADRILEVQEMEDFERADEYYGSCGEDSDVACGMYDDGE